MSIEAPEEDGKEVQRFARVLNTLFATRRTKGTDGRERPYTLREVAQGTGISIGYLSEARRGNIDNPSVDKIELLAHFFGVNPSVFLAAGPPETTATDSVSNIPDAVREALSQPLMDQIVLRAGAFSDVERSMILEIMDKVEQWSTELAARDAGMGGVPRRRRRPD